MRRRALLTSAGIALSAGCGATDGPATTDAGSVPEQLQGTPTADETVAWTAEVGVPEWVETFGDRVVAAVPRENGYRLVALDPATGERTWATTVAARPLARRHGETVVLDVGRGARQVVGLDLVTGDRRWTVEGSLSFHSGTTDRIVVERGTGSRRVTGHDPATGDRRWAADAARGLPGRGDRYLHLGPDTERIVARSITTGERLWTWAGPTWTDRAGVEQVDDRYLFASPEGSLVGLDGPDGSVLSRDELPSALSRFGVRGEGRVVFGDRVGTEDDEPPGRLAAAEPTSGVTWSQTLDGADSVYPFVSGGVVYAVPRSPAVVAFAPADGGRLWRRRGQVVASGARGVYVARDGRLRALDRDGRTRWVTGLPTDRTPADRFQLGRADGPVVVVLRGTVFVVSERGLVVYDAATGERGVRARLGGRPETLGLDADRVFAAVDETLYAVSY